MAFTLESLSQQTGLTLIGDGSVKVASAREPGTAGPGDLALAMDPRYAEALAGSAARAAVVWPGADIAELGLEAALEAPRGRLALAAVTAAFQHPEETAPGIHPSAIIHETAEIGEGAAIGPLVVIGAGARIGPRAIIANHTSIGADATLGADAILGAGVRIGARVQIGDRFRAQPGAVIGADGFSYVTPEKGSVEAAKENAAGTLQDPKARNDIFVRIHSLAAVEIGDDVEIGANSTIDRGTIAPTRIGSGTKIDNLVQIGHNVQIGVTCLLCGHVGVAGSVKIGDRVVLGGKTGIGDHLEIGSDAVLAGGSLVGTNVPPGAVWMGVPAAPREATVAQFMALRRLPRVLRQIAELRAKAGL